MQDRIEVVNRLNPEKVVETIRQFGTDYDKLFVFDKIHHEMNQVRLLSGTWCAAH